MYLVQLPGAICSLNDKKVNQLKLRKILFFMRIFSLDLHRE